LIFCAAALRSYIEDKKLSNDARVSNMRHLGMMQEKESKKKKKLLMLQTHTMIILCKQFFLDILPTRRCLACRSKKNSIDDGAGTLLRRIFNLAENSFDYLQHNRI
jgi:hypothetical protein